MRLLHLLDHGLEYSGIRLSLINIGAVGVVGAIDGSAGAGVIIWGGFLLFIVGLFVPLFVGGVGRIGSCHVGLGGIEDYFNLFLDHFKVLADRLSLRKLDHVATIEVEGELDLRLRRIVFVSGDDSALAYVT